MENKGTITIGTRLTARHFVPKKGRWNAFLRLVHLGGYREVLEDRREVLNRCVTDAFVNKIVDALQAAAYINDWKYHDSGTGVGSELASDTTLGTPWGGARDVGTQIEGASANIYKSVATTTYTGTYAITEHGLFDAATSGTLMDRTKFAAMNVNNGDKIEFTFEITFSSGG